MALKCLGNVNGNVSGEHDYFLWVRERTHRTLILFLVSMYYLSKLFLITHNDEKT